MTVEFPMQLGPGYLRPQADRCQRLLQNCTDLGTARDLRLMSEEYVAKTSQLNPHARAVQVCCRASDNQGDYSNES
jgi:hypothetical protein